MEPIVLTEHARMRMDARRIPVAAVEMAFLFGRYEGLHVVCAESDVVMTAYRNRDLSGLRPRDSRRTGRCHGRRKQWSGRIGESESAFPVCLALEKEMAVH